MDTSTTANMSNGQRRRTLRAGGFTLVESSYDPGVRMPTHVHDYPKISLIVAGGTRETAGRGESDCTAGSVVVKPADARHGNWFGPSGMRTLIVYREACAGFRDAAWERRLGEYRWFHGGPVVRAMFRIYDLLRPIRRDSEPEGMDEALYVLQAALDADDKRTPGDAAPRWLEFVAQRLQAERNRRLHVESLAHEAGVHPVYLARAFRRRHGCTMTDYVHRLRARDSAKLLAGTKTPLAQVAIDVGFADQAHFTRVFRAHWGLTPGRYRILTQSA